ncbi:MAG: hypothetical protein J1F11_11505 [Oscillospiraceae bacterium]|nr:hypothetical protein [Oscillospiraceae bacterium]
MYLCDFAEVFGILLSYATGLKKDSLYSEVFHSYYEFNSKEDVLDEYTANKVRNRKKALDREGRQFYAEADNYTVLYDDLQERVLPYVSDKFGMCSDIRDLIIADSMNEADRDTLLKFYPNNEDEILDFLTKVIIFSLNRPTKAGIESPLMSERINLSAVTGCKYFCGRKNELQTLSGMLEAHDKIFICGVGGIGKSEFVRKFIKDHKSDFTNVLYLTYSESLKNTIAGISFKGDDPKEKIDVLYANHMNYLRVMKNDTLIVIDNFDIFPYDDDNYDDITDLNCKVIFTTRSNLNDDFDFILLEDIDKASLFEIAEKLDVTDIDRETLDNIFEALHKHTLACELILRLLKRSSLTPDELLEKIRSEHVDLSVSDKIRKDKSATYYEHIHQLFRLFALTDEQKDIMRLLALIPIMGIDDAYFNKLTKMPNMNVINGLDEIGLVTYSEHLITVHPLIGEAAAADLVSDMISSRQFIENLNMEFQFHIEDKMNELRQVTILEIADRIVEFTQKNDIEFYFRFLIDACPYAETFEDKVRMKHYISEMEKYLKDIKDQLSKAVYYMCKAAYAQISREDTASAIEFTRTAQKLVPDVLSGDKEYSQREVAIYYNICNNLCTFYCLNNEENNAKIYLDKARQVCEKFKTPIFEFPMLVNNLYRLGGDERKMLTDKS